MKRAYHGDWMDALPSRFINEIPDEGVEKNDVNFEKQIDDFEFNQDNTFDLESDYKVQAGIDTKKIKC